MSVDISVSITEDVVDIIATPTVNIVNVTNSASIDPGLYDLSDFTNTSVNPFTRTNSFKTVEGVSIIGTGDIDITKASVGLGNVDNTSDLNKPISTATQTALNAKVTGNTAIIGATKTKITYDSKGLVTSGADATTADIADSLNKRYVTDANLTVIGNTSGTNTGDQTLTGLGGVPTSRTLTINGTTQDLSADRTFTISTGITIGTTAITSGTVGRVLFQGTGNVVSQSTNLFWDSTNNRLGIGTSSAPSGSVYIDNSGNDVKQHLILKNSDAGSSAQVHLDLHNNVAGSLYSSGASLFFCSSITPAPYASALGFWNYQSGPIALATSSTERMRVSAGGNVLINTTTDAGFKLDVNGTARVNSSTFLCAQSTSGGNGVNIGTQSLGTIDINQRILQVDAGLYPTIIVNANNVVKGTVSANGFSSVLSMFVGTITNHPLSFSTNDTSRMRLTTTGNLLINTTTDIASSKLTVESTTQGFLPPRMTTTQKNAIATPAEGLQVWDTTLKLMSVYNGTAWITL